MTSLPLHPAVVHVPLGLAVVLPLVALGLAWAVHRGWPRGVFAVVVALHLVVLGGGLAASRSGQTDEAKVDRVVPVELMDDHKNAADLFNGLALGALLLALGVMAVEGERRTRALAGATVVASLLVAAQGVRVGRLGGEMVYRYNAAASLAPAQERPGNTVP
jgi:uncharacterized membrane protein